ncbi:hypothetical protein HMPREF0012_01108 [Acinetobacter calcoaceticus RUH2202]|nr:hypothetical protein HMPREF0012_01108 [Acinetobacter calcoaceticus RUH2202]
MSPRAPSTVERRGTPSGVLASFDQSANPFRSATIIYNVLAELQIKRSWLCTFIISWQSLPKAITIQLKSYYQLDYL